MKIIFPVDRIQGLNSCDLFFSVIIWPSVYSNMLIELLCEICIRSQVLVCVSFFSKSLRFKILVCFQYNLSSPLIT